MSQVAEAVARAGLQLAAGVRVKELNLFIVGGGGDEVFMHVEAGHEAAHLVVPIGVELHTRATQAGFGVRDGAEVIDHELKCGRGQNL